MEDQISMRTFVTSSLTDFLQCCIQILFFRLLLIIALQTLVSSVKIRPELVYSKCQDFFASVGDSEMFDLNAACFSHHDTAFHPRGNNMYKRFSFSQQS